MLPGLIWVTYCYCARHSRSQPFALTAQVFIYGCASTVPAAVLQHVLGGGFSRTDPVQATAVSFLLIGPTEEFVKMMAVWIPVYRSLAFREPIDGIVYGATAALGFASIENIIYMRFMGPWVLILRALYATPAHVMFASMWGYSMGVARFQRKRELFTIAKGFLAAALLHGAYNFLVVVHELAAIISLIPLMVIMALLMRRGIRKVRATYPFPALGEGAVLACPACGAYTLESEETCSRCKYPIPAIALDGPRYCGHCRALLIPDKEECPNCRNPVPKARVWTR